MKKLVLFTLLAIACSNLVSADEYPFACSFEDLGWMKNTGDKYFVLPFGGDKYTLGLGDAQTINIDKKNKIVKVWLNAVWSKEGKQSYIAGREQKLSNLGFSAYYLEYDLKNNKSRVLEILEKSCKRDIIFRVNGGLPTNWKNIYPDTQEGAIAIELKKKYKL